MAIGPRNKVTTTGLIDRKPMIPEAPVMAAQPVQQTQQVQPPTQAQVTPPVDQTNVDPLKAEFPDASDMEIELANRFKELTAEDRKVLSDILSPSVINSLGKLLPEFTPLMEAVGRKEPNVIFPLSSIVKFAMTRYGGKDEQEAVNNFMTDVASMNQQMETQNNVPPGTEQPTETAGLIEPTGETGLMSSPQNMETV